MITVNDQLYAAFGGIEGKRKYDAKHRTYEYIEERLAYTDFIEQNILINLLLHFYENSIPTKVINEIYDEITNKPITNDTPQRIKNKVQDVILETPECVDTFARSEIDRLLTIIESIFTILNAQNETINNIKYNNEQAEELFNIIAELNTSVNTIKQKNDNLIKQTKYLENNIDELNKKNKQLEVEILLLKRKNQAMTNDIKELSKNQYIKNYSQPQRMQQPKQHNSCLCDEFNGRYSSFYGMVI